MPAQPLPAVNAGALVMKSEHHGKHLRAILFRRAETGAWVQLGPPVLISYALAQEAMARVEGTPYPDELGFVGDVDELGAFGKRIKRVAKKIAASKLVKKIGKVAKMATAFIPGAGMVRAGFKAAKGVVSVAKGFKRGGIRGGLKSGFKASSRMLLGGVEDQWPELGAAKPRALPAPKKRPAPKPIKARPIKAKAQPKPIKARPIKANKAQPKPIKAKPIKARKAQQLIKARQGKPAAVATRPAGGASRTIAPATAAKIAELTEEIEDAAPELAQEIEQLPEVPPDQRGFREARVKEALKVIAAKPPEERPAAAAAIQARIDAYKVIAPDGAVKWVPRAVAEA